MKKLKESDNLIIISSLRKIIEIFFGPFLTTYFIKVSYNSLLDLSIYNIITYIVLGIGGLIVGYIVRNKFQLGMFRIGVISNFIYILSIVILKESIIEYLPIIAFLYGFSLTTYYYPYNLFIANKVTNKERANYELKKQLSNTIIAILTPIILGGIITTANFQLTALIILFISLIQIILSFFIKPHENKNYKFTPIKSLKNLIKNKDVVNMFKVEYFKGMNVSSGALEIVVVVLIFNAFRTDLNLGILSSISSIFMLVLQYIYTKKFKNRNDKLMILLYSIIPVISLILFLNFTNNITVVLYYFCYTAFVNVLNFIISIRLYNLSNIKTIREENEMEFWSIRELVLNLGRITSYILLFIIAKIGIEYLNYLLISLTLTIIFMAYYLSKINRNEK